MSLYRASVGLSRTHLLADVLTAGNRRIVSRASGHAWRSMSQWDPQAGKPNKLSRETENGGKMSTQEVQKPAVIRAGGGADAVYGIGMIGAWVYTFRGANTPKERVQAFFRGLVWPAFLVYDLFTFLEKE
jgi:hypothetical protein